MMDSTLPIAASSRRPTGNLIQVHRGSTASAKGAEELNAHDGLNPAHPCLVVEPSG